MNLNTVVGKFPAGWRGLLGALAVPEKQLLSAELWLQENKGCGLNSNFLSWADLLQALVHPEPVSCTNEGVIVFQPRLFALPQYLQRLVLAFIHHHKADIPSSQLQQFTSSCSKHPFSDDWSRLLLSLLQQHVTGSSCDDQYQQEGQYEITADNVAPASELVHQLRDSSTKCRKPCWMQEVMPTGQGLDDEAMPIVIDDGSSMELMSSQVNMSQAYLSMTQLSQDESMIDDQDADMELSPENEERIIKFKEIFASGGTLCDQQEVLVQLFVEMSPVQVQKACEKLEFEQLEETQLSHVCDALTLLADRLLYGNSVTLTQALFFKQVAGLEQTASRSFLATAAKWTDTFPRQMVEAVLVPVAASSELGPPQVDFIVKNLKESCSLQIQQEFIRLVLEHDLVWNASLVSILHMVLDQKLELEKPTLLTLTQGLERVSDDFSKDLKFGKLVLAIINKQAKSITTESLSHIQATLAAHKTFLAKSAQTAIKKLKMS